MPTETVKITTADGHELAGSLELPTGLVRGAALFAHCFTCTKQSRAAIATARALASHGIATLRFDFTGLGGSEGEIGRAGFATDVSDLVAAAQNLIDRFGEKVLLVGHSLGGAAVLAAADDLGFEHVAGVATIGAPSDVPHALERIEGDIDAIKRDGQGDVTIGGRPFLLSSDFIERTESATLLTEVERLRAPVLILHSPTDAIVGVEHASKLFQAAKHPKSFISLHGADHLLLKEEDAQFAAAMIASWANRYLPQLSAALNPDDGVIIRTGHGKFGTEVHTSSHRFIADEPTSYGGDNTGPTPYDLLLASLGTCTAMTMKMYADRKGIAFEGTTIHVTHERNHSEDLGHEMEEDGMPVQALHRAIELHGDLSDAERAKLIEIADKCPVHKTLEGHLHVHTKASA